jgi:long-chain acyl-CoA synthetase
MLTHRNFCSNVKAALGLVPFGPSDHHLSFLPLCHSFERMAGYTAVLSAGARISFAESIDTVNRDLLEVKPTVMISVPRLFERVYNAIHKAVREGSPTRRRLFDWAVKSGKRYASARRSGRGPGMMMSATNAIAQRLVFSKLHARLGGNLRFAISGGAALPKEIGEFFEAAGIALIEGYGLTETSPVLSLNPIDAPRYGTVGHVLPGVTIAIQRLTDGALIAQLSGDDYPSDLTSSQGEIVARGPNIMKGYWNNEAWTRECIDAAGWYHTGDVGRFDGGYLQITDRIKHMIVSKGGKNIYPGPIEDLFKSVPWIDQLVVVGEGREFLSALVVPSIDALRAHAKEQGIPTENESSLLADERILALFEKEFRTYSRGASAPEKIRKFRVIPEPFTVDNGLMTPTLKPRRKQIEAAYAEVIDAMYEGVV